MRDFPFHKLKETREQIGIKNTTEMGKLCNVSQSSISRIENGKYYSGDLLLDYLSVLHSKGVDINQFFSLTEEDNQG